MRIIYFLLLLIAATGCKKPEDRKCWKSAGKSVVKRVEVGEFTTMMIKEHLEIELIQDTVCFVNVLGGENMVNLVEVKNDNGLLTLSNKNKCSFLRKYSKSKIKVEIHFKQCTNIEYQGSSPMYSRDTLHVNYFVLLIRDGSSSVDLTLKSDYLQTVIAHGFGDFTLRGKANYANLDVRSNGFCHTENLNIRDSMTIISNTPVHSYVNAANCKLKAQIESSGNIYYTGTPTAIQSFLYGSGSLIKF